MTDEENKILIADDDGMQRDLHHSLFEFRFPEFDLEFFAEGSSLENRLNTNLNDVRLVITDNHMPGITGSEIIQKYAKKLEFSKIPFILCYGGEEIIGKKAVENGAFGYIIKGGDIDLYFEIIKKALDYKSTQSSQ